MELPKNYDSKVSEKKWQEYWETENIYKYDTKNNEKDVYSIDTPPPTVSGKMHIGHAFSFSQQDFIARYKRMKGYNVFYPFGTDDNGLATEKLVQKDKKINLRKIPRDEAIKICLEYLEEERPKFIQDWKDIGMSCDFSLGYSTINEYSRKISQKSFLDLVKKGIAYRKEGPIMWDRIFQTAIAQAELEDLKQKSTLNFIKAKIEGEDNTYIIYATTRPELLYGCVGVSVENKGHYVKLKVKDEIWITGKNTYEDKFKEFKYEVIDKLNGADLIGKKAIIPISENIVEIDHDDSVKADYGTGIVYFCTYGGLDCVEWMQKRPDKKPIELLFKDGKLNNKNKKYEGLLTSEARKIVIEDLEKSHDLIKKENVEHIVNVGERSGAEVEYIISKQWYIKYLDKRDEFLKEGLGLNWYPDHMKNRLENWIKGLNWDWSVSRQRHFGVPIPVWYDKSGNIYYPDESQLPVDPVKDRPNSAPKNVELIPETDVFDTWFTSASTPFLAVNLVDNNKKLFPMDLRPQAHDIINFWLFYTLAKTRLIHDKNPWKNVTISGWALDPHGRKMSKSKGNVVSPQEMSEKYSADALRFWAAGSKLGDDMPFQEKDLVTGKKTATKMWNASKFAIMHLENFKYENHELAEIDKWILSKLHNLIKTASKYFDNYEYSKAKLETEKFFWHVFCDNYLELVKDRLYNPENYTKAEIYSAKYTLYESVLNILKLFSPFIPYITEEIYQLFFAKIENNKSIHISNWPIANDKYINEDSEIAGEYAVQIISEIRKFKSLSSLSLKEEIKKVTIESNKETRELITPLIKEIMITGNVLDVEFSESNDFKINVTN